MFMVLVEIKRSHKNYLKNTQKIMKQKQSEMKSEQRDKKTNS